ncbi:D-alanyl-D-alanine carboxypeptidase/D-alanyl-D-alanine-endopeptidase [Streptomyces roseifaciens]|uniref:D-alanyl-D-alanine carboxypeptidase/D-alanyl-D-alanine endopeptidase n=1 Tax=Streptomyces roseifaciens TaxID=1488406 RepID=UPI000717F18F|nr:D-alanyl-D-alanine carboxypeptidase/D-alanyl-D-alanine-endopeptidase [Streptomyces roseifaciens]
MTGFTRGWRARAGIAVAVITALTAASAGPAAAVRERGPGAAIEAVMKKPGYEHARWGLLEVDEKGRTVRSKNAGEFFIPGSAAKLFSVSATWRTIGGDHRFTTPVLAVGHRNHSVLDGHLVLVGQGDLSLGGRTGPGGTMEYTDVDHTYANDVPGATLTPQNPLAGIDELARQVRHSGITEVNGDVVVDSRLFTSSANLDPGPTPLIVNDNVIDLLTTPTSAGHPAKLDWRPHVAPYQVDSHVRTVPAGGTTDISVTASPDGTRITLTGTVAAGAKPVLRVSPVRNPDAFGRTALIEALGRAGVTVHAHATGPNPAGLLRQERHATERVAAYVSPPYAEYAKVILKVSHNLGANLGICLMAVHTGSHSCDDGFRPLAEFVRKAGADPRQLQLLDGRGGNPVDRIVPTAFPRLLRFWERTPDAARFRKALPILGVDGSLAGSCTRAATCPAHGKVFAKPGTVAGFDAVNNRLAVGGDTLAGYFDTGHGRHHTFFIGVNGASAPDIKGLLAIIDDLNHIAALLQQQAAAREHGQRRGH